MTASEKNTFQKMKETSKRISEYYSSSFEKSKDAKDANLALKGISAHLNIYRTEILLNKKNKK